MYNCLLIWHICSSADARSIEKIQPERSLRFVLNEFTGEYGVLMEKSLKSTAYLDRLRQLCVETYKATNGLAPVFVSGHISKETQVGHIQRKNTNMVTV